MTLEKLLEDAVIADYQLDTALVGQAIRNHDYAGEKSGTSGDEEARSVITVTVTKQGEFKTGSGICKCKVDTEIRVNGAADSFTGTLLDQLAEAVENRLQPSANVVTDISGKQVTGREAAFSTDKIKVFGILQTDATARTSQQLEQIRTVSRTFIAAQLAA